MGRGAACTATDLMPKLMRRASVKLLVQSETDVQFAPAFSCAGFPEVCCIFLRIYEPLSICGVQSAAVTSCRASRVGSPGALAFGRGIFQRSCCCALEKPLHFYSPSVTPTRLRLIACSAQVTSDVAVEQRVDAVSGRLAFSLSSMPERHLRNPFRFVSFVC
jgi:hypothetical protein